MADHEVKIRVTSEADASGFDRARSEMDKTRAEADKQGGRGPSQGATPPASSERDPYAGLEKRRQELLRLRREEKDLEGSGLTKSARQVGRKADRLETEINREATRIQKVEEDDAKRAAKAALDQQREEARATKERAAEEKRVTREINEQAAARKAGIRTAGRTASGAAGIAQQMVAGGDPAGSASSMLMSAGMGSLNPAVMVATTLAAIGTSIARVVSQERDKDTMQGMEVRGRAAMASYRINRQAGAFGSSGALVSTALDAEEELAQRKIDRVRLQEKSREKWHSPSTWQWFGMRKNEGTRESEVNEAEIEQAEKRRSMALAAARRKHMGEEGGLEMENLRGRSMRSLDGQKQAFVADMAAQWLAKYKEQLHASGDDKIAKEMADLTVQNQLRDRQAQAGAGLVDARSGGAGIAAAAAWSQQVMPQAADIASKIESLHGTVQQSNRDLQMVNQAK
jgi:hypothetical protein